MRQTLLGFLRKEFVQTLRDPVMRLFIFAVPVIQLILFGYAISLEFRNLKLASIYEPKDYIARQFTEAAYASGWFVRVKNASFDGSEMLRSGIADAVLVMPKGGLTKAILNSNGEKVQLLIDATNSVKARSVESYLNTIAQKFTADKFPDRQSQQPVAFDARVLFNPTLKTAIFMVPGIMTLIICIITIILTAMSLAREKELGTFETIIAAPLKNIEIILGKAIPFVILGLTDALFVILAGVIIFDVPVRGSLIIMFISALVFVSSTVSFGIIISTFAKNQQQAMMGAFLFLFPMALMSGLFFPVENMPGLLRLAAYLDPLKYFISILRNIMIKGANPELVWSNLGVLVLMTAVIVIVTNRRFRQTLN